MKIKSNFKNVLKNTLLTLGLLNFFSVEAIDNKREWVNIAPDGVNMSKVVFSQSEPNTVYALSEIHSILYKSKNGGGNSGKK